MLMAGLGAEGARCGSPSARLESLREMLARYRHERRGRQRVLATGLAPLDSVLPGGGLPVGAVTEILSDGLDVGALTLALRVAGVACLHVAQPRVGMFDLSREPACLPVAARRESPPRADRPAADMPPAALFFVDTCSDFYPPAALTLGIDLNRLWVVRPRCPADAFWAVDQALRCPAVGAVIAPLEKLDDRASRRLQLSAEAGGGLGLLLRPARAPDKSFAAIRIAIEPLPLAEASWDESSALQGPAARLVKLSLIKVREGMPIEPFLVDLNHETGAVPVLSEAIDRLAPAARTCIA